MYNLRRSLIFDQKNSKNNSETSPTTKIGEYIPCIYSMSTIWAFHNIENKRSLNHGEDYMKTFFIFLREHAADVVNFKNRKLVPLTEEELKLHQDLFVQ